MRIPDDPIARDQFIEEITRACEVSQMDRMNVNTSLRNYAIFGGDIASQTVANYNKIWPTLQLLSSFLYAQETVNFSTKWGVGVPFEQAVYGETLRKLSHQNWEQTKTDGLFGDGVLWSLVYNTFILKVIWNGGLRVFPVYPHMIGVYREDIASMDNQEAITHLYYSTLSNLRTMTRVLGKEKQDKIMERVTTVGPVDETQAPQTVTQMILMNQIPNVRGAANPNWGTNNLYKPQTTPDLVEMRELWIYDDNLADYRVFTIASSNVVIFDRPGKQLCTEGQHPFIKITPFPLPDYFWGMSLTQSLIGLQDWHDAHLKRCDVVFRRKLRPSRTFTGPGWGQLTDEKMMALDMPGGQISSSVPGAKADEYVPQIPMQECILWLNQLDEYFNETAGLGANIMRAEGDMGVRSMQHAQVLERMGSARIKKTALVIEDPAEKAATLMMKMQRDHDTTKYLDDDNKVFLLSQVDPNFTIKVSGHSLSPVFVEDTKNEAKQLVAMNAMTRERYIDETRPPMADELQHDLKTKIEPAEKQRGAADMGLKLLKATKGKLPGV